MKKGEISISGTSTGGVVIEITDYETGKHILRAMTTTEDIGKVMVGQMAPMEYELFEKSK